MVDAERQSNGEKTMSCRAMRSAGRDAATVRKEACNNGRPVKSPAIKRAPRRQIRMQEQNWEQKPERFTVRQTAWSGGDGARHPDYWDS
jgi:hypothetical protein